MYKLVVALSKEKIPKNIFDILLESLQATDFDPLATACTISTSVPAFARMLAFSYSWLNVLNLRYDSSLRNKNSKEFASISTGYTLSKFKSIKENDVQRKCEEAPKIAVQVLSMDSNVRIKYSLLVFEIIRLYFSQDKQFLKEVHDSGLDDSCWWKIV